ncbi:uncharacterized protein N7458_007407 [Penicillium daleae]|uniref:Uncharacterized protein n=1 Tax=Penicillium daleae TaxID=63821 RepID=A0AAD6C109_9EURO|nr:uncharacterized protein N7458_007407 [Penicillium daleae]KAJ5443535.1 hypothetical protein N7458_007407 [Penicillium daleae]
MSSAMLVYSLAGAAVLSAIIVTIFNGLAYAALQSLPSHTSTTGLAPVLLSILTCITLLALSILINKDLRSDIHWPTWKIGMIYFTGVYLVISAVSVTGTIASNDLYNSPHQGNIFIARSIFWALSVLTQGLYYGFLVVTLTQRKPGQDWPRSYVQELKSLSESPDPVRSPARTLCDPYPELKQFDTRRSSLRKYPRRSNRFSGGTICIESTRTKYDSFDTSSSTLSSPSPSPTTEHTPQTQAQLQTQTDPFADHHAHPNLKRTSSFRSMPSLRREANIQLSLDSLVQTSPTASSFALDSPSASTLTLPETYAFYSSHSHLPTSTPAFTSLSTPSSPLHSPTFPTSSSASTREQNIHPLFRSTSPCPSPTPLPGSTVKASPSAGQTITQKTLTRMRSARELRQLRKEDSPGAGMWMGMGRAGYVRRSITQYEKRGDLNDLVEER